MARKPTLWISEHAMRLDDYHMLWLSFSEGVIFTLLFLWLV